MIIISWYWRHRLLQNINIFFLGSVVKNSTFLTYNILVKTNSCVYVAGVKCFLFAFWVKGQSCWNGQEIASTSDSLPVYIEASYCDLRPLSSLLEALFKFCCWDETYEWQYTVSARKYRGYFKRPLQIKDAGIQIPQVPLGAVTCSTNGYIVLVGKWAAGRLFPALDAPMTNSLRKALMPPPTTTTTVFKPTSLTLQVCSCKGHSIPGCTWCNHPKVWKQFHGLH